MTPSATRSAAAGTGRPTAPMRQVRARSIFCESPLPRDSWNSAEPEAADDGEQHGDDEQSCEIHAWIIGRRTFKVANWPCVSHPAGTSSLLTAAGVPAVHRAGLLAVAPRRTSSRPCGRQFAHSDVAAVEANAATPRAPAALHARARHGAVRYARASSCSTTSRMRGARLPSADGAAPGRWQRACWSIAAGCRSRGYRDRLPDVGFAGAGSGAP